MGAAISVNDLEKSKSKDKNNARNVEKNVTSVLKIVKTIAAIAVSWMVRKGLEIVNAPVRLINEQELKKKFAYELLRNPSNPFAAANELAVSMEQRAHIVAKWTLDPIVQGYKDELLDEHGPRHFLPSREEAARLVWDRAQSSKPDDFVKLMKLYGDYMGFIEKPGVTVNNTTNVQHNVMHVPMAASEDEWEARAIAQQESLTEKLLEKERASKEVTQQCVAAITNPNQPVIDGAIA